MNIKQISLLLIALSIVATTESIAKGPKRQAVEDGAKTSHIKMKSGKKHKASAKKKTVQGKQLAQDDEQLFPSKKTLRAQARAKKEQEIADSKKQKRLMKERRSLHKVKISSFLQKEHFVLKLEQKKSRKLHKVKNKNAYGRSLK